MKDELTQNSMDDLRELGYDLEPVVARQVRSNKKSELVGEIVDAVEDGGEAARKVLRAHFPSLGSGLLEEAKSEGEDIAEQRWKNKEAPAGKDAIEKKNLPVAEDAPLESEPEDPGARRLDFDLGSFSELKQASETLRRHPNGYFVGGKDSEVVALIQCDPIGSVLSRGDLVPFPKTSEPLGRYPHTWLDIEAALAMLERRDARLNMLASAISQDDWNEYVALRQEQAEETD